MELERISIKIAGEHWASQWPESSECSSGRSRCYRTGQIDAYGHPSKQSSSFLSCRHTPSLQQKAFPLSRWSTRTNRSHSEILLELEIQTLRKFKIKTYTGQQSERILNSFWSLLINKAAILNNGSGCQGDQRI